MQKRCLAEGHIQRLHREHGLRPRMFADKYQVLGRCPCLYPHFDPENGQRRTAIYGRFPLLRGVRPVVYDGSGFPCPTKISPSPPAA